MRLGFVSALLADRTLEQVLESARELGFDTVELLCWPVGKAERRYAGVTHVDVVGFTAADAERVRQQCAAHGIAISGLGYYPNPLVSDPKERAVYADHLKRVIEASALLGVGLVESFVGRDHERTVDANWPVFEQVWPPLVEFAEQAGVRIAIENCPMLFSADEWPGGKNLATTPENWRRMFETIPSPSFGLVFDPSHLVWQFIDIPRAIYDFHERFMLVHAKDVKVLPHLLYERGVMGLGWSVPKLPGLGDTDWGAFFSALSDVGYTGDVCIEVEDRAYEADLAARERALEQSRRFLLGYLS